MGKMYGGRYELEEKIGAGGMAIVYKAKDTLLNRTVAVKVLREQYASDEGFIRRFRREAQSAASLSHHNIVSVYDVGKDGNEEYIVMEYVKGQTLKDIIRTQAPLSADKAIFLVRQIAEALAHAHANHIIHRDIKPQNILVTNEGKAKVTDFGIARAASSATLTHTGDIVGSVHYLSPEQAKGAQTNEQSDIYSLGIILYELITGQVPYDGDTPITIALKHIQEEPEMPGKIVSGVSPELDTVIRKCLAKSVQERYQSASELLDDLDRIMTGQTIVWDRRKAKEDPESLHTQIHKGMRDKMASVKTNDLEDTLHKGGKRKKVSRPVWIALISILIFSGVSLGAWKFFYVPDAIVPDLHGLTIDEAELKLKDEGLLLGENPVYVFDDEIEKDKIVSQSYDPDTTVKAGRIVDVTVSQGIEFMEFPDVTSTNPLEENAINAIRAAGFEGEIETEVMLHPAISEGKVIAQSPAPRAVWSKKGNITLFVSGGQELTIQVMPDVAGWPSQQAKEVLEAYKLVVTAETEGSDLFPPDAVITTFPAPGQPVKQGSEVKMVVSEGPGPPA